jgi:ribonuclease HI
MLTMQNSFKFTWVKGHDDKSCTENHIYNDECDRLAVLGSQDIENYEIDRGYESGQFNN